MAQIVLDGQPHGAESRPLCANASRRDCTLEPSNDDDRFSAGLGLCMVEGLANVHAAVIVTARIDRPAVSADDLWHRAALPSLPLVQLAEADAFLPIAWSREGDDPGLDG